MNTVLLLGRGERLAPIFGEFAKSLSTTHKVILTLGINRSSVSKNQARLDGRLENIEVFDLPNEIKSRYQEFDKSRQSPQSSKSKDEFVQSIEKRLGITFYHAASNYLTYRRFHRDYYGFWDGLYDDDREIEEEFIGSFLFFDSIFNQFKPQAVYCETPDIVSHRIASALAYQYGVFPLGTFLLSAFGKGRTLFTSGSNRDSVLVNYFYKNASLISHEAFQSARQVLKVHESTQIPEADFIQLQRRKSSASLAARVSLKKIKSILAKDQPLAVLVKHLQVARNLRWLNQKCRIELPQSPYLLFCLHHQPEAATSMVEPRWIDQDRIIEQLAIKAPAGLKIVVKENPKTFGLRGQSYFGHLARFPNVYLLHPKFDQAVAIQSAQAVLTISGTVGLEGILMRKKVAILSSVFYSHYTGARRIQFPEEIFSLLEDPSWQPDQMEDRLLDFTAACIESSFYLGKQVQGTHWPSPEEGGPNLANGVRKFLQIVEKAKLNPQDFSLAM